VHLIGRNIPYISNDEDLDLNTLRPVMLHPKCQIGWLAGACPLDVADAEVRTAIQQLLELHPVLRVCITQHGQILYPWSAEETERDGDRGAMAELPMDFHDVPLFRWCILKRQARVKFWIHHDISDAESINIVTRDFSSLLHGKRIPPRPYHLLRDVHKRFADLREESPVSLSPGTGPTWMGYWAVDGLDTTSDVLAWFVCAFLSASRACGQQLEEACIPVTFDSRFMPELDSRVAGLLSFMVVQKLCTFPCGVDQDWNRARHVIDATKAYSRTDFMNVINFTIDWDEKEGRTVHTGGRLIFARASGTIRNALNLRFYPRLGRLRLEIVMLEAPMRWMLAFEHALDKMLPQQRTPPRVLVSGHRSQSSQGSSPKRAGKGITRVHFRVRQSSLVQ